MLIILSYVVTSACCRKRKEQEKLEAQRYQEQSQNYNHDEMMLSKKEQKKVTAKGKRVDTDEDEELSSTNPNAFLTASMLAKRDGANDSDENSDEVSSQEIRDKMPADLLEDAQQTTGNFF